MKKLITILFVVIGLTTYGQTTINPDTVCINATGEQYFVTNTPTSTYTWNIAGGGGTVQTGQGTNSITVDWGAVPGLYLNAVGVTETNFNGCPGNPIVLDVYVLNLFAHTIGPFCPGDPPVVLSGTPIGGTWSGTGVVAGSFDPTTVGVGSYILTYSLAGCSTTINAIVNNGPITGPIQHY